MTIHGMKAGWCSSCTPDHARPPIQVQADQVPQRTPGAGMLLHDKATPGYAFAWLLSTVRTEHSDPQPSLAQPVLRQLTLDMFALISTFHSLHFVGMQA